MAYNDFNVGANVKAPRRLLKHFVDMGSESSPNWELLGVGVEDSAIDLNAETEELTDIYGNNESSVKGWKPSQSFDPHTVKGGSKLALFLHECWMNTTPEKLSMFKILTVYAYVGDEKTGYDADIQEGCTIVADKIGGSAYVDMPITVKYSNRKQRGTVTFDEYQKPTFVASTTTSTEE